MLLPPGPCSRSSAAEEPQFASGLPKLAFSSSAQPPAQKFSFNFVLLVKSQEMIQNNSDGVDVTEES
jgi:hypothetical protein